jgi:hypothetical protein
MTTLIQSILKRSDLDYATFTDSVSKLRVSNPESLIDTDFEYGLQSIKWETIQMVANIPLFFNRTGDTPIPLADVTTTSGTDYIYVTTQSAHNFIDGAPIYIAGLKSVTAEGFYLINKILSTTQFVYRAKYSQTVTGSLYDANTSYLFAGLVYQGTSYNADQLEYINTDEATSSVVTVKTLAPHGFSVGANFSLTNTVGRRVVSFLGTSVSGTTITTIAPHNLYNGMSVVYSNGGGATVSGLVNGNTYYVMNSTQYTISLSLASSPLTAISLTAGTGTQTLTSTEDASDGSFYLISTVPDAYTFTMPANAQILRNSVTFDATTSVIQNANVILTSTVHKTITGAPVVYNNGGGTSVGGLTSGTTYYAIRVDPTTLKLATTRANALAGTAITFTSQGTGSAHTLTFTSIMGEVYGTGTVTTTTTSQIINGNSLNFLSYFKYGDKFRIVVPAATATISNITSVDTVNRAITVGTNIASGTPVRFTGTSTATVINNYIYYAQNYSATQIALHLTYTDSIAGAAGTRVDLTSLGTTGNSVRNIPLGSVMELTISEVQNSTKLKVSANPSTAVTNALYLVPSGCYPFADGYVYHRAHDGGVELIPSKNADAQITRQTRKYFRYQPGKGIQCSLSVNFSAPLEIDYLSRVGSLATGRTRKPHRMQAGLNVTVSGAGGTTGWNGTYTIVDTPTINTFTFTLTTIPTETVAPGYPSLFINGWTNSRLRAGLFDDQNGMYFEYDGQYMYAVRRDSVSQLSGLVSVVFGSQLVTKTSDTNTSFLSQLTLKQNIVIRGQTYRVVNIVDDNTLYIQPPYRGVTEDNVLVSVVTDVRVPQTQWSVDKCDGTGPTGYLLDRTKIQMIYMDYSWYGAGKIRFGFKDTKGEVRYVHEFLHNNRLNQAYFRSGNLPARYEVFNVAVPTWVPPLLHWGTAIIMDGKYDDDKAYLFTASGNLLTYTNGDQIVVTGSILSTALYSTTVYDPYTQTRLPAYYLVSAGGASGNNTWSALQNLRSGTLVTGTGLAANTKTLGTPQRDNTDPTKAIIFIDRQPTTTTASQSYTFGDATDVIPNVIPLVSIRVAPSVDSSITGPLGVRELINRMQLRLKSVGLMTTNDTEIRLYLNSFIDNKTFKPATSPSLSQLVVHSKGDSIQDGTILFSYRVPGGVYDSSGKRNSAVQSYDISELGYLGNSIQGGDSIYPDGPDVLTLVAVCLDPAGVSATTPYTVSARVSWAEAQA